MPRRNGAKADAIRAAIAQLGGPEQAKNADVVEAVGKQGFKSSSNEVSMYKTKLRRAPRAPGLGNGSRGRKPGRPPSEKTGMTQATNGRASVSLAEIQTMRAVIGRLGAAQMKQLIDVLA